MQTADDALSTPAPGGVKDLIGHEVHPWRRYFARIVDLNLSLLLLMVPVLFLVFFLLAMISSSMAEQSSAWLSGIGGNRIADIMLTCLLWVPCEILYMLVLGTTPGKWIFGVRVRDESGKKLKPALAAKRAASVYFQGLGLGLPLISLVTLVMSYNRLTKESITAWDERLGTEVSYTEFGALRALGATLAVILTAALIAYNAIG